MMRESCRWIWIDVVDGLESER